MYNILLLGGGSQQGQGSGWQSMVMLLLIFVVFYVFMILPQSRKAKNQKKFREELGKGSKIVTLAGIHGKIVEVDETTFVIETEDLSRLRIEKAAISMEYTQALNKPAATK